MNERTGRACAVVGTAALIVGLCAARPWDHDRTEHRHQAPRAGAMTARSPGGHAAATASDSPRNERRRIDAADARFRVVPSTDGSLSAATASSALSARYDARGATLRAGGAEARMHLASVACDAVRHVAEGAAPATDPRADNRVSIAHAAGGFDVVEWFEHGALGIEQGFDVAGACDGELRLSLALEGMGARADRGGLALAFDASDVALRYDELFVVDADGRTLAAHLEPSADGLSIAVDARGARYPIVVDPLISTHETSVDGPLQGGFGAPNDQFGRLLALDGTTTAIVAPEDVHPAGTGSVYVYVKSGGAYALEQRLTAPAGASPTDYLQAITIAQDTLAVSTSSTGVDPDGVHVYVRSGGVWSLQAAIAPPAAAVGKRFGSSLALSADTLVVGASGEEAAYVFVRSGTNWFQQARLAAPDATAGDSFGASAAIDGNTVAVGARSDATGAVVHGSAYVFVRSGTIWSWQQKLVPTDASANAAFGSALALSADTLVLGAPDAAGTALFSGAAYVFVRTGTVWSQQQKLVPTNATGATVDFGQAVDLDVDTVVAGDTTSVNGAVGCGAAYVFVRSGSLWSQQQKLGVTTQAASCDLRGSSVGLAVDEVVVGAPWTSFAERTYVGAAYASTRAAGVWSSPVEIAPGQGAVEERFGQSFAVSGDRLVGGAAGLWKNGVFATGGAFAFLRSGTTFASDGELIPTSVNRTDYIGQSVDLDQQTAIVGATGYDYVTADAQGTAYVFVAGPSGYVQQQQLLAVDGDASDEFGYRVAVDGDTAAVTARTKENGATAGVGVVYVFVRTGTVWSQQAKLDSPVVSANYGFGRSLVVAGDVLVASSATGDVHVFRRSGGAWSYSDTLNSPQASSFSFGSTLALAGTTLVVAAPNEFGFEGRVYVYDTSDLASSPHVLAPGAPTWASSVFGLSVATDGDVVVVAMDRAGAAASDGDARLFVRNGAGFDEVGTLLRPGTSLATREVDAVAIDGNHVYLASSAEMGSPPAGDPNQGVIHVFRIDLPNGARCTVDAQCGQGHCVDGVCCDSVCTGQCEACDLPSTQGTCSPVTGAPHGARTACADDGATCGAESCGGVDRTQCVLPGASVQCSAATCAAGMATGVGVCGAGTCNLPASTSCGVFACGATDCLTSCAGDGECASGFYCSGTGCVAMCTLDTQCSADQQCTAGRCVMRPVASAKSGCSVGGDGGGSALFAGLALALAAIVRRGRRPPTR